jgi:ribonuclease BN (tRNA processing enzyme)
MDMAGKSVAYTGDTAWTDAIAEAAADAGLLIAEAYHPDKDIPHHLRLADLAAHRHRLTARRVILTHMSAGMLEHDAASTPFERARDGLAITL